MMRLIAIAFALAARNICTGRTARAVTSAGRHDHTSPRSMRCRYAHGQWYLRAYCCPQERRQVCGWNANSWRPLR